jgi:putative ABC transport system substrate-binding protein
MNNRRKLVVALGAGALAAPFGPSAQQQAKVWRIGVLNPRARPARGVYTNFFDALRDLGYVDGRNIAVQWQFADENPARLPELAAQLVKDKVDLIVTTGTPAVQAGQQATATIPIVALAFADPVGSGFAKSLARPGGNITGTTILGEELEVKRLELLMEIVPHVTRIAYLVNLDNPFTVRQTPVVEKAARKANKEIVIVNVQGKNELSAAFAQIVRDRSGAVLISQATEFDDHAQRIGELALQHKLPYMTYHTRSESILVSYAPDFRRTARSAAMMAVKLFKGTKAGDIPIEQPTHFRFIVNLKAANTLGITIPPAIMVQATEVIE